MSIEPAIYKVGDFVLINQKKTKNGTRVSRIVRVIVDGDDEDIEDERGDQYSTETGYPPGTDPKPWKAHIVRKATEADFERYATEAQKSWRKLDLIRRVAATGTAPPEALPVGAGTEAGRVSKPTGEPARALPKGGGSSPETLNALKTLRIGDSVSLSTGVVVKVTGVITGEGRVQVISFTTGEPGAYTQWTASTGYQEGRFMISPWVVKVIKAEAATGRSRLALFDGVKVGDQFEVSGDQGDYTITVARVGTFNLGDERGCQWALRTGHLAGRENGPCVISKLPAWVGQSASPEVIKALESIQAGATIKVSTGGYEKVIGTAGDDSGKVMTFSTDGPDPAIWVAASGRHFEDTPASPVIVEVLPPYATSAPLVIAEMQGLAVGDSVKLSDGTTETVTGLVASDCKTLSFTTNRAESGKYWTLSGRRHGDYSENRVIQVIKKGSEKPAVQVGDVTKPEPVVTVKSFSLDDVTLKDFVTAVARWVRG